MYNVGIVGYGNLGKQVEQLLLQSKDYNLVAIFSRRKIKSITPSFPISKALNFKNKIDFMLMCGGSDKDLMKQSPLFAKNFSVIDTFDTHQKIYEHFSKLNKINKKYKTNSIICCGWDPGLFSVVRCLYNNIFEKVESFWGNGISMGHSNAIKNIDGVTDAIQYTIPNKKAVNLAKKGKHFNFPKHYRKCFVSATTNKLEIKQKIKNIPYYFKGQPTKIKFVSTKTLNKKRKNLSHKGSIFAYSKLNNNSFSSNFNIKTSSNPLFTAKIMTCYLNALSFMKLNNLNKCLTPIQIPVVWLFKDNIKDVIKNFC